MPDPNQTSMEIQSFRLVFDLERRLHRIDRWRLPIPNGIPLAGIAHAALALLALIAIRQLPIAGQLLAQLPAPVAYVLLPAAIATGLTRLHIDGRPAHRHLTAQALTPITTRQTAAGRTTQTQTAHITEAALTTTTPNAGGYPDCQITGPATIRLTRPVRARPRGNTLHLTPLDGPSLNRPKTLRLQHGQQLKIRNRA